MCSVNIARQVGHPQPHMYPPHKPYNTGYIFKIIGIWTSCQKMSETIQNIFPESLKIMQKKIKNKYIFKSYFNFTYKIKDGPHARKKSKKIQNIFWTSQII